MRFVPNIMMLEDKERHVGQGRVVFICKLDHRDERFSCAPGCNFMDKRFVSDRKRHLNGWERDRQKKRQTVCIGLELKLTDKWRRKFHRKRRILRVPKMAGLPELHLNLEVSLRSWMELCFSDRAKHLTKRKKVLSKLRHIVAKNCLLRQGKFPGHIDKRIIIFMIWVIIHS